MNQSQQNRIIQGAGRAVWSLHTTQRIRRARALLRWVRTLILLATALTAGLAVALAMTQSGGTAASGLQGTNASNESAAPRVPTQSTWLGINVEYTSDWSSEIAFNNVFMTSRPWVSAQPLNLTPQGWIASLAQGQVADTFMLDDPHRPTGNYTLLYDGQGTLSFAGNAPVTVVSQQPGRWVVAIGQATAPIDLRESATDAADPIRNIRLLLPGTESTYQAQPFNQAFLNTLAPFGVIRFVTWDMADDPRGSLPNWSDRPVPTSATQSTSAKGVALEYMIQLCNTLHADPWFNIPYAATDSWVVSFAQLVESELDPGLKAYVEYSNETWNGQFAQAQYVEQQGLAEGLSTNTFQAGLRYYAQQSTHFFSLMEPILGPQRLVRVLSSQFANPWTAQQVLGWNSSAKNADAYAVAPYIECLHSDLGTDAGAAQVIAMSTDQILDNCFSTLTSQTEPMIQQNQQVAASFGLPLIAYEGGQSLVAYNNEINNAALTSTLIAANESPRMGTLTSELLGYWQSTVGTQFTYFASVQEPSKYGSWGALDYQYQDPSTAPKYQALMQAIAGSGPTPILPPSPVTTVAQVTTTTTSVVAPPPTYAPPTSSPASGGGGLGTGGSWPGSGGWNPTAMLPVPMPSQTIAYLGCSNTWMAVQGYHDDAGSGMMWPALPQFGGGSIDQWVPGTSNASQFWDIFNSELQAHPVTSVWWHLCMHPGTTLAQAESVLTQLRSLVGTGVQVYASAMAPYAQSGECAMADPAGSQVILSGLLSAGLVKQGPVLTQLSPSNTQPDGCHPLPSTADQDGRSLQAFFG